MDSARQAEILYRARIMQDKDEVRQFEEALEALASSGDPSVLPSLYAAFDDSTQQQEVMWGLIHAVEVFEAEDSLREMARAIPEIHLRAKEWIRTMHFRILNDAQYTQIYKQVLKSLSHDVREVVQNELNALAKETPEFRERVSRLLSD